MSTRVYCPIKDSNCDVKQKPHLRPTCFVAIPFRRGMAQTRRTVTRILEKNDVSYYLADKDFTAGRHILCKICEEIVTADFGVVEATTINPNVMLEFGIFLGKRKPVFILFDKTKSSTTVLPSDITALDRIEYRDQQELSENFEKGLRSYLLRINLKERQLESLLEFTKLSAKEGNLVGIDSLLHVIFNYLVTEISEVDRFVKMLEKIVIAQFKHNKNIVDYLRFKIASMRIFMQHEQNKKALKLFNEILPDPLGISKESLEHNNRIVSTRNLKNIASEISYDPISIEEILFFDNDFRLSDLKSLENTEKFFALLWFGLLNSNSPKIWMKKFTELVLPPKLPPELKYASGDLYPAYWFDYYQLPWHGSYQGDLVYVYWLGSVLNYYDEDKNVLRIAHSALRKIRMTIGEFTNHCITNDEWYEEEYLAHPRFLIEILERQNPSEESSREKVSV